jgi:hypothetical protein
MPKEDNVIDFENQKEWTFNYEVGLSPQFELTLDKSQSFEYNTVKIDDELVDKYLKDVKRNYGKPSNPDVATEVDVLYIDIVELDADNNIVAGGIFKSTSIGIDRLKNEAAKAKLIGATKDSKIIINANELYDSAVDKSISLGIDKEIRKPGALVYLVDSSIQSGLGPVQIYPSDLVNDPLYFKAPLSLGESITVNGVKIKVVKADDSGDTVEISK